MMGGRKRPRATVLRVSSWRCGPWRSPRAEDGALDLSWLRSELAPHYSSMGHPSIDPELMIRMLVAGNVFAIRSERLICREVTSPKLIDEDGRGSPSIGHDRS